MSDRPPAEKEHAFSSENDQLYDQDDQRPDTHSTDTMDEDVGVHHSLHPYSDDVDSSNVQQSQAVDDDPHRDDHKYDDEEDDNLESSGEQHPTSPQVGDVDDESRINDDDETRLLSSTAAAPSAAPATLAATSTRDELGYPFRQPLRALRALVSTDAVVLTVLRRTCDTRDTKSLPNFLHLFQFVFRCFLSCFVLSFTRFNHTQVLFISVTCIIHSFLIYIDACSMYVTISCMICVYFE